MASVSVPVLGWFAGNAGALYEQSLTGLIAVLDAAGETHWRGWVARSLDEWRASGGTARHRRAYGGMGSFNDLQLTQPGTDVALNCRLDAALDLLRSSSFQFSQRAETDASQFTQSAASTRLGLHWYRCRSCDADFTTAWNLESAAAAGWASYAVPRLVTLGRGTEIADAAAGRVSDFLPAPYVKHVEVRYAQLGVEKAEIGRHWESPCPRCGRIDWWYTSASAF